MSCSEDWSATSDIWDYISTNNIVSIHDTALCYGRVCIVHNPTDHHMRSWPLHFRNDRGIFERICPHGVGHYDPDQLWYHRSINREWQTVHGCDGCCQA